MKITPLVPPGAYAPIILNPPVKSNLQPKPIARRKLKPVGVLSEKNGIPPQGVYIAQGSGHAVDEPSQPLSRKV